MCCGFLHPCQQCITPSEFVKSRLLNKDSHFRKEDQYMSSISFGTSLVASMYNLLKGTCQHPVPVRDFVDHVATNEEHIEASLSTVFWNMHGSNWYLCRSEVFCMVREYGSPSLFLTLSCAALRYPPTSGR